MRDIVISAILILVLSLLTLERPSLITAFIGAGLSIHLVWSRKGKDSSLRSRSRRYTPQSVGISVMLLVLFISSPPLLFGLTWGYIVGAALTYVALTEANKS